MLATLILTYYKKSFNVKNERPQYKYPMVISFALMHDSEKD